MKISLIAFFCCLVALVCSFIFSYNESIVFDAWLKKCRSDGGIVSQDGQSLFSEHFECMKNGMIINHVE